MVASGTLFIRADAGSHIGTGHLMRCLALAQAWKGAGGKVVFITACRNEGLLRRIREEEIEVHLLSLSYPDPGDWEVTKNVLARHPGAWVVLDGYHFNETYQKRIKDAGNRLLVIDDMVHLKHYYADIVLNQNLHAEDLHYSCEPYYTKLLLGTKYVLLRREFLAWRDWKREIPKVARRVLVTLGGSDPGNYTLKVIQALQKLDISGLEAIVVIGASNPHADVLKKALGQSCIPIRLIQSAKNMPELMAWADVAIAAGGTTCWELAFMGVPSLVLILAENQRLIAEGLDQAGAAVNLGWHKDLSSSEIENALLSLISDKPKRAEVAQRAQALVDGSGSIRLLTELREEKTLTLRRVREEDCRLLWEWANDPQVRAAASSSDPISWEDHVKWFASKLNDPNCIIFVALDNDGASVGQIRFDITDEREAEIDVNIDRKRRGLGYGTLLIDKGVEEIFRTTSVRIVHAFIKPDNVSSIRAFEKVKFKKIGLKAVRGHTAIHYLRRKNDG